MEHAQKMVMVPYEQQTGGGEIMHVQPSIEPMKKGNKIKDHALERQKRLLSIVLKLAEVKRYNNHLEIRRRDGTFMQNTDLIALLLQAVTPGRILLGQQEFVDLLREARVDPELVANLNIRSILLKRS